MRYYGARLDHRVSLPALLKRALSLRPDSTGLVTDDGAWTWQDLETLSDHYAANLIAAGLRRGDRIASFMPNCGALFVHYLGVMKAGLVMVALNYRYTPFEIDHALEVSGAKALVFDAERGDAVAASSAARSLRLRYVRGVDASATTVETLMQPAPPAVHPEPDPDAPVAIFFTSGSTGPAKGVTHTHGSLGAIFASIAKSMQLSPDDRLMGGSSCSHIGGFMTGFGCFSEGAMFLASRVGRIDVHLGMMRRWRPTVVLMLPAALFDLERDPNVEREDFASCRLIACSGDKVPEQLEREFSAKTGLSIGELYGMTELGMSHINPSSGLVKLGSVGRTACGFAAEICDEDGNALPPGEAGRLWLKSPTSMMGYWDQAEATAQVFDADGWFDTGDMMRADTEGFLSFCGRKKQIIVHDGSNIFPQEVEDSLLAHPAVARVGVVGIADTVHGENVRAYVELGANASAPPATALIAFSQERVGYKAPEEIVFLEALPLNATGKVDRVALKRLAADAAGASEQPGSA